MKSSILVSVTATLSSIVSAHPGNLRRAAICGSRGYDAGTDSFFDSAKYNTYAACSSQCQKNTSCKSFALGSGRCYLYDVAVTGNFEADSGSPYAFYDRSCLSTSSTTASSISSTVVTTSGTIAATTKKTSQLTATTTVSTRSAPTTPTTSLAKTSSTTTTAVSTTQAPPCPYPTWTITNFRYINSTHNLDCAGSDYGNDLCMTGKNPQPDGYGPPDSITADISQIGSCAQQNPGSVPLRVVGDGNVVRCAGSQIQFQFYGNSRQALSYPLFALQNSVSCDNGASYRAYGQANLAMSCTYDAPGNATCLLYRGTDQVVPTSWSN